MMYVSRDAANIRHAYYAQRTQKATKRRSCAAQKAATLITQLDFWMKRETTPTGGRMRSPPRSASLEFAQESFYAICVFTGLRAYVHSRERWRARARSEVRLHPRGTGEMWRGPDYSELDFQRV